MEGSAFVALAVQLALMLTCGVLGGAFMRRLHQPAILGEMIGGILLGPTVFGALWPAAYVEVFNGGESVKVVRGAVVQLGMLFFLLGVGLEIDLAGLRRSGLTALAVGVIGSLVPLGAGIALVYALPGLWNIPADVSRESFALFIGVCLANTANPVLARILADLGLFKVQLGGMIMAAGLVDDLVGWSLLAIVLSRFEPTASTAVIATATQIGTVLAFFAVTLLVVRFVVAPLLRVARQRLPWPSGFLSVTVIATLLTAAAAEHFGIHAFLGPLVLGVAISPSAEERHEAYRVLEQFALSFFVPIYFVSLGMAADYVSNFHGLLVLAILLTASVSKIAACFGAARLSGLDANTSAAVACGMNARGAMGVLLAGIGLTSRGIDSPTYVALVVMALVTSLAAGPLMQHFLGRNPAGDAVS